MQDSPLPIPIFLLRAGQSIPHGPAPHNAGIPHSSLARKNRWVRPGGPINFPNGGDFIVSVTQAVPSSD
jgi:hypothetical protein